VDYFEGLLLGTLWSDTDYENRRHLSLFILYGMLVCGVIALNYFTGSFSGLLSAQRTLKLVLFLALFLASPFMCFRYYRFPVWIKIPVLFAEGAKYIIMTLLMTTWIMPYTKVSFAQIQTYVMDFLNKTLESSTARFAASAGTFSTVLGVITGGVYVVFLFAAILILAVMIPGTVYLIVRLLQYGYDKLVGRYIIGQNADR